MKILLLHQYYLEDDDPGGSRWNEITRIWKEDGHDITVLAGMMHYNGSEKRTEYKKKFFVKRFQNRIEVIRCHVSESYNTNFLGRLWGYFSFMFSSLWAGLFKTGRGFDVVIVTSPPLFVGVSGYLISLFKRIPFIFEVRDLWPESAIDTGVLKNKFIIKLALKVEKFIYNKASMINVLTPAFKNTLIEKKGIDSDKIIFIPNAADFDISDELLQNFNGLEFKKKLGFEDKFVITYVGAHGVANHLVQILDTAELLNDTNVIFQLIGDGMEKLKLIEETKKRGLTNIVFRDSVPKTEVFKYILASDLGTSVLKKVETFKTIYSNKTFDYMACKKPVLLLIDGVSRELIEEANCGIYAEPENPIDIADKIRHYLSDSELIKLHGENGYNYAKKNFDRNNLSRNYLSKIISI